MFDFIKRLFGIKEEEKERIIIPNFRHTPPPRSKRSIEVPVREPSTLRRVYNEPTKQKDDSGDFLTSMVIAQATDSTLMGALVGGDILGAMVGDSLNDSDSNHSGTGVLDGGFGGGDYSGGGAGGSWDDSSSSSNDNSYDSSSSYDSSYDSSSSYDSDSSSSSD